MLNLWQVSFLIAFSFLLAAGQILFKLAAMRLQEQLINPYLIAALLLYVSATACWLYVLKTVPLSQAYVFSALGFVIVPLASVYIFGDCLNWRYGLGVCLIVVGVYLAATSSISKVV